MKHNEQRLLEIQLHIADWRTSGLSQAMFCKKHGLAAKTFGTWIRKYGNPVKEIEQPRFMPILPCPEEGTKPITLTIHYPNGIKIACPSEISATQLQKLIHLLD